MMRIVKLIISVIIAELAGIIGSVFTAPNIPTWYATINKPFFNPPSWIFAPVWTTLFVLMGISLFLIWDKGFKKKENKQAVYVFGAQLVLNVIWSLLFFGLQSPFYAFIEIIILWIAILVTIWKFYKIDKKAAWLLVPYILWVTFAAFLNLNIWLLNF
ncbi:MAG: TspO/MBR family protein [Candidatus Aenigmatarchaeota archaeon]